MQHRTMFIRSIFLGAVFIMVAAFRPVPAGAAGVSILPAADGLYGLQGTGFENVSAMDVTIRYDASLLGGPQVVLGPLVAGTMTAVNTTVPGSIRIVLVTVTPIQGSGSIATLTFSRHPAGGRIVGLNVRLADLRGTPLPVVVKIEESAAPQTEPPATAADQPSSPGGSTDLATSPPPYPLTAILPLNSRTAGQGTTEGKNADTEGRSESSADVLSDTDAHPLLAKQEPAAVREQGAESTVLPFYRPTGVLDRFLEQTYERTPEVLLRLFRGESMIGWRQAPPVLLSDGRTSATVTFLAPPGLDPASNIAVMGATLVSLVRDRENSNTWIATLLPEQGTWRASLAVRLGDRLIVYPLTVAPGASSGLGRPALGTEKGLRAYLAGKPVDLNGDGQTDSIDDFIAAANFLAARGSTGTARQDRPVQSSALR